MRFLTSWSAVAILLLTPVYSIPGLSHAADTAADKNREAPTKYSLTVVHASRAKGDKAVYRIPDVVNVRFQTICECGLLTEIAETGVYVKIQFSRKGLTEKTDPKLLKIGTHIESVEPKEFSPGDTVTITIQNYAIAN